MSECLCGNARILRSWWMIAGMHLLTYVLTYLHTYILTRVATYPGTHTLTHFFSVLWTRNTASQRPCRTTTTMAYCLLVYIYMLSMRSTKNGMGAHAGSVCASQLQCMRSAFVRNGGWRHRRHMNTMLCVDTYQGVSETRLSATSLDLAILIKVNTRCDATQV